RAADEARACGCAKRLSQGPRALACVIRGRGLGRLAQPERCDGAAIGDRYSRGSRRQFDRAGRALEGVTQVDRLRVLLDRGNYLLGEQAHAGTAIVSADRPLNTKYDEDARAQHTQDGLDFRDQRTWRAGEHLQALLPAQERPVQFAPDLSVVDFAVFGLHLFAQFRSADAEPRAGLLLRHQSDRVLGIISGWHRVLRSRERILPASPHESLRQLLRLGFGLGNHGRDQIAEVFRARLIAVLRRLVSVVVPQVAGRTELGAERDVWIAMRGAPLHGLRAEDTRNPHWRMRLLIGQRPRIDVAIMEVLALVAPRAGARPGLHDEVVSLVEQL